MKIKKNILSKRFLFHNKNLEKNNKARNIHNKLVLNPHYRKEIKSCNNCGLTNFYLFSEIERNNLPINFLICISCGLVSSQHHLSENFIIQYYKEIYNKFKSDRSAVEAFKVRTHLESYSYKRFNFVKNNLKENFDSISIVMEPGCNDGCNLLPYFRNKIETFGCDFNKEAINQGRQAGINIFEGEIEKLIQTKKKADLIILSHLIAHIPNINDFLKKVEVLLAPDGYVYVETPSFRYWGNKKWWQKRNKDLLNFLQFEFVYIFEKKTLIDLMKNNNFIPVIVNEKSQGIFKKNNGEKNLEIQLNYGKQVLTNLKTIEDNYLKHLSSFIHILSKIKFFIKNF